MNSVSKATTEGSSAIDFAKLPDASQTKGSARAERAAFDATLSRAYEADDGVEAKADDRAKTSKDDEEKERPEELPLALAGQPPPPVPLALPPVIEASGLPAEALGAAETTQDFQAIAARTDALSRPLDALAEASPVTKGAAWTSVGHIAAALDAAAEPAATGAVGSRAEGQKAASPGGEAPSTSTDTGRGGSPSPRASLDAAGAADASASATGASPGVRAGTAPFSADRPAETALAEPRSPGPATRDAVRVADAVAVASATASRATSATSASSDAPAVVEAREVSAAVVSLSAEASKAADTSKAAPQPSATVPTAAAPSPPSAVAPAMALPKPGAPSLVRPTAARPGATRDLRDARDAAKEAPGATIGQALGGVAGATPLATAPAVVPGAVAAGATAPSAEPQRSEPQRSDVAIADPARAAQNGTGNGLRSAADHAGDLLGRAHTSARLSPADLAKSKRAAAAIADVAGGDPSTSSAFVGAAPIVGAAATENVKTMAPVTVPALAEAEARGTDTKMETGIRAAEAVSHRRVLAGEAHGRLDVPELGKIEVRAIADASKVDVHVKAEESHAKHVIAAHASQLSDHVQREIPEARVHVERPVTSTSDTSPRDLGRNAGEGRREAREGRENTGGRAVSSSVEESTPSRSRGRVRIVL